VPAIDFRRVRAHWSVRSIPL